MPQVLIVVGRVLAFAILGYFALIFTLQRRMAFPGTFRDSPRPTAFVPPDITQVWLEASFGRVEAWFFRAEGDVHRPTIIFAHGNGELIEDWQGDMERLAAAGANVLLVEFPGYGPLSRQAVPLEPARDLHTCVRLARCTRRRGRRPHRSVWKVAGRRGSGRSRSESAHPSAGSPIHVQLRKCDREGELRSWLPGA